MSEISADRQIDAFIDTELALLHAYDSLRPKAHVYEFHMHSQRVADDMRGLALKMGMNEKEAQTLYRLTLVHDIGKRLLPVTIWDDENKPSESVKNQRREHTHLGVNLVDQRFGADNHHPFLELMRDLMAHHHEAMDGSGWMGLKGDHLSTPARMLCICDAFDGYSTWRPHFGKRDISIDGVLHRMGVEKAGHFDPAIFKVFADMKREAAPKPDAGKKPRSKTKSPAAQR